MPALRSELGPEELVSERGKSGKWKKREKSIRGMSDIIFA
jgi:hypothetical protein